MDLDALICLAASSLLAGKISGPREGWGLRTPTDVEIEASVKVAKKIWDATRKASHE
jgi:hypothetical protein